MLSRIIVACAALASTHSALAGPEDDAELLKACMFHAPDTERHLCIGNLSRTCQETPGGGSTIGIVECVSSEEKAWDHLLNIYWKDLREWSRDIDEDIAEQKLTAPSAADTLLDSQRAWIKHRDAECTFRWLPYAGGTIRGPIAAQCMLEMTAARVLTFYAALSDEP